MQLRDYLQAEGVTAAEFARRIDRSEATVSRLLNSVNRPDWGTMTAIESATNGRVRPNDFSEEAKCAG